MATKDLKRCIWPGTDPLGQRISIDDGIWLTVIGISANARQSEWAAEPDPEIYLAALQNRDFLGAPASHSAYITLVMRTRGNPAESCHIPQPTLSAAIRGLEVILAAHSSFSRSSL